MRPLKIIALLFMTALASLSARSQEKPAEHDFLYDSVVDAAGRMSASLETLHHAYEFAEANCDGSITDEQNFTDAAIAIKHMTATPHFTATQGVILMEMAHAVENDADGEIEICSFAHYEPGWRPLLDAVKSFREAEGKLFVVVLIRVKQLEQVPEAK